MGEPDDTKRIATAERGPDHQLEDGGVHELIREQRALRSDIERLLEENRQLREKSNGHQKDGDGKQSRMARSKAARTTARARQKRR